MKSILLPRTEPPKSSIAILAASTPPDPMTSAYSPDMSSMSPITTLFDAAWAADNANELLDTAKTAATMPITHLIRALPTLIFYDAETVYVVVATPGIRLWLSRILDRHPKAHARLT